MWNRNALGATAALVAVGVGLFATVALAVSARDAELGGMEVRFGWIVRAIGVLVTGVSALAMLVLALLGAPIERLVAFVLPVLAGALLVQPHWAPALALGALAGVVVVRDGLGARYPPPAPPTS